MRLPLSLYSRCVASTPHGFSPGASAARTCTPGNAIAAAVSAANRGLIAATAASADAGRGRAAFLGAVRAVAVAKSCVLRAHGTALVDDIGARHPLKLERGGTRRHGVERDSELRRIARQKTPGILRRLVDADCENLQALARQLALQFVH